MESKTSSGAWWATRIVHRLYQIGLRHRNSFKTSAAHSRKMECGTWVVQTLHLWGVVAIITATCSEIGNHWWADRSLESSLSLTLFPAV